MKRNKCRQMLCTFLVAMMVLVCVVPCMAMGTADTGAGAQTASGSEIVRVAVIDYPNYINTEDDGSVSGYAYEYLMKIRKYTGWKYQFIEMSFADATKALEQGTVDIVPGNQYTDERAEKFDFSKRDMGEGGSVLCVMPDDMRYGYNDYASYSGLRIASLKGSVRMEQTKDKLEKYGAEAKFIEYDTDEASKQALEDGEVDAVLMSTIRCETNYKILARVNSAPVYFCMNKQRPELKAGIDEAMEQIHLDQPYYEEDLDQKYYGSVPVQTAFTPAEREYIASAAPITVAASDDLVPVEYYSSSDGEYKGVVPDNFRLIAEYSGLTFNFVSREDSTDVKEKLVSGQIQAIASVADDYAVAESWGVNLSNTYYDNSISFVINDDIKDYLDPAYTVVVRRGYPYLENLAKSEGYTNIVYADTFSGCVDMVSKKDADIALIPSNCAECLTQERKYSSLVTYLVPNSYMKYCVGVSETADPLLLSIINKSIGSITREQKSAVLVQNLTSVNENVTLSEFISTYRFNIAMTGLAIAILIILASCWLAVRSRRTNVKLQQALKNADAANQAKTDFLARMSHDMRTPMNGILGLTYLMEDQPDINEIKREIPKLRESGQYLLQLINDILDVNKVESGEIELHPRVCDEEVVFNSIIELMRPQIEQKSLQFNFEKINIEWTWMILDEQRVKQIFVNLLSNAVKFTPEGGKIDFIMELVSEDEHMIRDKFIVRDNGIGMTEEFLPRIFEPFAQENRLDGGLTGTGLGLVIVKRLVELMGGSISVKSKVNEGTEVTLYLNFPLAKKASSENAEKNPDKSNAVSSATAQNGEYRQSESSADAQTVSANQQSASGNASSVPELAGTRILLCEDHPLNAQIATRLLEKKGAAVVWKENGKLGADEFNASEPDFYDAVLMDIRMPVMDGIEAAKTIRALDRLDAHTVPIIAMTANAYEEDIEKSLTAGMNAHLAKPVEPAKLYSTLAQYIFADKK